MQILSWGMCDLVLGPQIQPSPASLGVRSLSPGTPRKSRQCVFKIQFKNIQQGTPSVPEKKKKINNSDTALVGIHQSSPVIYETSFIS